MIKVQITLVASPRNQFYRMGRSLVEDGPILSLIPIISTTAVLFALRAKRGHLPHREIARITAPID